MGGKHCRLPRCCGHAPTPRPTRLPRRNQNLTVEELTFDLAADCLMIGDGRTARQPYNPAKAQYSTWATMTCHSLLMDRASGHQTVQAQAEAKAVSSSNETLTRHDSLPISEENCIIDIPYKRIPRKNPLSAEALAAAIEYRREHGLSGEEWARRLRDPATARMLGFDHPPHYSRLRRVIGRLEAAMMPRRGLRRREDVRQRLTSLV